MTMVNEPIYDWAKLIKARQRVLNSPYIALGQENALSLLHFVKFFSGVSRVSRGIKMNKDDSLVNW